jgi:hypothetical protein
MYGIFQEKVNFGNARLTECGFESFNKMEWVTRYTQQLKFQNFTDCYCVFFSPTYQLFRMQSATD